MFDTRTSTMTTRTAFLDVTVEPNEWFDTVGILKLDSVLQIQVDITAPDNTLLHSHLYDLRRDTASWIGYYFDPFDYYQQLIINPMIFFAKSHVRIRMTGPSDQTVGCGVVMVGRAQELGMTLLGAKVGISDYSTKETDAFGETYLLQRAYADTADIQMVLPSGQVDEVRMRLTQMRGKPCLFNLNNKDAGGYDSLMVFGYFPDFSIDIQYETQSFCSLSVEALA